MKSADKLFRRKSPYIKNDAIFVSAMRENAIFQYENCEDYKRILDNAKFSPYEINEFSDIEKLPFIPTIYFKRHKLFSMSERKMLIKATSSGTSGKKSEIGFDFGSLMRGLDMVINLGKYHHLWSIKPAHYIIFGYEPSIKNKTGISQTSFGFTFFAPALSRTYALKKSKDGYELDMENIKEALIKCEKSKFPLRTVGFSAYTYFLLKELKDNGIHLKMPRGSIVGLGGGWKQFYTQKVDKNEFYSLVSDVLAIDEDHIIEFFGAVEHPILYTDCRCHHFHIPIYSRVIIRDPHTFKPLPYNEAGLINLITPMVKSVPLLSIMTDDIGILHNESCPCGESSPWLEIVGRVGIKDIIICAQGAEELLREQ